MLNTRLGKEQRTRSHFKSYSYDFSFDPDAYYTTTETNTLTVEFDRFSAASDVAEIADGDLSAVGHATDERTAGDRSSTVLYVDLVIA